MCNALALLLLLLLLMMMELLLKLELLLLKLLLMLELLRFLQPRRAADRGAERGRRHPRGEAASCRALVCAWKVRLGKGDWRELRVWRGNSGKRNSAWSSNGGVCRTFWWLGRCCGASPERCGARSPPRRSSALRHASPAARGRELLRVGVRKLRGGEIADWQTWKGRVRREKPRKGRLGRRRGWRCRDALACLGRG